MFDATDDATLDRACEALKFLSDKNRLRILSSLTRAETCVADLIGALGIPQPLVSYHLGKLRKLGLVRARRDAQWVYYSLDPNAWAEFIGPMAGILNLGPLSPSAAYGAGRRASTDPTVPIAAP
jgi:DNA-binding transcriptional ArsR family regulator